MKEETVRIYVITYQRPILLKRALKSLIGQSYKNWIAEVINDDPLDREVEYLIKILADERITMKQQKNNCGPTRNFNYCFKNENKELFSSILEDDNWWEPDFLQKMMQSISDYPDVQFAISNENIWIEEVDGSWYDSKNTVRPQKKGSELLEFALIDKCGGTKLCNSAMLWKTSFPNNWTTPDDLPVDVSEHFRERIIPHPILLVNEPLVNFAQTLQTVRSNKASLWGTYQVLLITSVFSSINRLEQNKLADDLWLKARVEKNKPYKTTLLHAALASKSTRVILDKATLPEILRYLLTWIKKPKTSYKVINALQSKDQHFQYLMDAFKQNGTHNN